MRSSQGHVYQHASAVSGPSRQATKRRGLMGQGGRTRRWARLYVGQVGREQHHDDAQGGGVEGPDRARAISEHCLRQRRAMATIQRQTPVDAKIPIQGETVGSRFMPAILGHQITDEPVCNELAGSLGGLGLLKGLVQ